MARAIHAIYANGAFRPTGPVDLPEHSEVEFAPVIKESPSTPRISLGLADVYAILGSGTKRVKPT
jgi:predicted DNA-binding antitoxin AbrB/MazE fold protein